MDVLPRGVFLKLMDYCAFEQGVSRVGGFDPAGQMRIRHRSDPPLRQPRQCATTRDPYVTYITLRKIFCSTFTIHIVEISSGASGRSGTTWPLQRHFRKGLRI